MKFFLFLFFLSFFLSFSFTQTYAVQDNAVIEGNMEPLQYSEQLYVVRVIPTEESRDIQFNVYGNIGKISSQEQNIPRGINYVNFYVKFFPPLYKIDEKYTLEVIGDGLIARSTFKILQDPSIIDYEKMRQEQIIEEKLRQEELARLDQQRFDQEKQSQLEQEKLRQEELAKSEQYKVPLQNFESENQNIPGIICGEGTVLENGLCIPEINGIPIKNNFTKSETPNWIYLLPIVFLIIIFTISKEFRNRRTPYEQEILKQNQKSQDIRPPRYDEKTIKTIRKYNKESFSNYI